MLRSWHNVVAKAWGHVKIQICYYLGSEPWMSLDLFLTLDCNSGTSDAWIQTTWGVFDFPWFFFLSFVEWSNDENYIKHKAETPNLNYPPSHLNWNILWIRGFLIENIFTRNIESGKMILSERFDFCPGRAGCAARWLSHRHSWVRPIWVPSLLCHLWLWGLCKLLNISVPGLLFFCKLGIITTLQGF